MEKTHQEVRNISMAAEESKENGRLFVSGKDTIIVPLEFKPGFIQAFFSSPDPIFPSCVPIEPDFVVADAVELKTGWGISISWSVNDLGQNFFREVRWEAKTDA